MNIYAVTGFALLACAASVILKKFGDSAGFLLPAAAFICLTGSAIAAASPVGDFIDSLDPAGKFTDYYSVMMKGLGMTVLGESAADICRDCGEDSIASGVEICTKISMLLIALPMISKIAILAGEFLSA